jgi:hypothetical protein
MQLSVDSLLHVLAFVERYYEVIKNKERWSKYSPLKRYNKIFWR